MSAAKQCQVAKEDTLLVWIGYNPKEDVACNNDGCFLMILFVSGARAVLVER